MNFFFLFCRPDDDEDENTEAPGTKRQKDTVPQLTLKYLLAVIVYKLTKHYPPEEKYGLVSQINRCAVSIPSNIAEGYARSSRKDIFDFCISLWVLQEN